MKKGSGSAVLLTTVAGGACSSLMCVTGASSDWTQTTVLIAWLLRNYAPVYAGVLICDVNITRID